MTLTFLMTSLLACGETGDSTTTTETDATAGDTTAPTSETDATASEPTSAGEPTAGTGGASETDASTDGTASTTAATTDATTADTSGETGTTGETTAADTTGEATGTTGETTTDTGETTDTTGDTGGTSPLVIAIVDAYLYADCMPMSEPDPVQGTWYVEFDNTANPNDTSAVLTGASLSLESADPPVSEPIQVSPIESPPLPAGEYISVEMAKLPGMAHSACEHCGEFYTLLLEYDEDGVTHRVEEAVTISCSP